jgi:outer membrane protein OmpA-like peptidoglycan-associated protein
VAARTPGTPPADTQVRVTFDADSSELPSSIKPELDGLAGRMAADPNMRVQLRAYAGGNQETPGQARRLSLYRALAVRSYLIERGIRSTRVDVRALGNKFEQEPADRVDVVLVGR